MIARRRTFTLTTTVLGGAAISGKIGSKHVALTRRLGVTNRRLMATGKRDATMMKMVNAVPLHRDAGTF